MPKLGIGETDHAKLDHLALVDSGHTGISDTSHEADHRADGADAIGGPLALAAIPVTLTLAQKDTILKNLLWYALAKEGYL